MRRAAFLDRDGVINRKAPVGRYITRWEEVEFLPGVGLAIRTLNDAGILVVIISNQRCVAKGLISEDELKALHRRMSDVLALEGARIDAIYYCPHESEPPCRCRKPAPGMLLDAARDLHIDLGASWMVGDSESDVEAGIRAGCHTVRITGGTAVASKAVVSKAEALCPSLPAAADEILKATGGGASGGAR